MDKQDKKRIYTKKKLLYKKESLSFVQQVDLLQSRGMIINNPSYVEELLKHVSYYHLEAYFYSYYKNPKENHKFDDGVEFSNIWRDYTFDRRFRELLGRALERIEISVKTQFVYHLSQNYGPFPIKKEHFKNMPSPKWDNLMKYLSRVDQENREVFTKHLRKKYCLEILPIWALAELVSFGNISLMISYISDKKIRKAFQATYGIDYDIFIKWIDHLRVVRNVCAHHLRLWNRRFETIPTIPNSIEDPYKSLWVWPIQHRIVNNPFNERRIYNTVVMIDYFLSKISPKNTWKKDIAALIKDYEIDAARMGFPNNWEKNQFWWL
ncbi:MAG: Abi family protein [Spirochaetota bacterium]|nr:Abi family protein [Spirochaetota bacterium]